MKTLILNPVLVLLKIDDFNPSVVYKKTLKYPSTLEYQTSDWMK